MVAGRLTNGGDLPHRLEVLAAESYRLGRLTKPDLRRLLGFETSEQIDTFLKAHEVYEECSVADIQSEVDGLRRLGC